MADYRIETRGLVRKKQRLTAPTVLSPADFDRIARDLGTPPRRARKVGLVAAKQLTEAMLHTIDWAGESTKTKGEPGDWLVTNLAKNATPIRDKGKINQYVIKAETFAKRYEPMSAESEHGKHHKARQSVEVDALYFSGGLDIAAPWGERQVLETGYLLKSGGEVYGNAKKSFDETYEFA
jgi:hypothetical protein